MKCSHTEEITMKKVKLTYFSNMTPATYKSRSAYYTGDRAAEEMEKFWQWVANAFLRYYEQGDIKHLNALVAGSMNVGRYRAFVRVGKALCCHEFNHADKQYAGKINKDKRDALIRTDGNGIPAWESMLLKHIDKEQEFAKQTPTADWSLEKRVASLIKSAESHGKSKDDIIAALKAA